LLKVSEDLLRERVIKVIRHDEGTYSETEWPWTPHVLDGSDLGDRPIVFGEHKNLALENPMNYALWIPLDFLDAGVHGHVSLANVVLRF
jgi:hypothetical protein